MADMASCTVIISRWRYWIVSASAERASNSNVSWGKPVTRKTVALRLLAISECEAVADPGFGRKYAPGCGRAMKTMPKSGLRIQSPKSDVEKIRVSASFSGAVYVMFRNLVNRRLD